MVGQLRRIALVVGIGMCVLSAGAGAQQESFEPNHSLTPGAIFRVTESDICVGGYTKLVRNVPLAVKRQVYAEYGIRDVRGMHEVDHLVSLEIGGSNAIQNLWPEPYHGLWNAHVKDHLENRLHGMVCARPQQLSLAQAQYLISSDWIAAYKRFIAPQPQGETGAYDPSSFNH